MSITIEAYNPVWKEQFESLRSCLAGQLKGDISEIVHVGSTAVPGMFAKPVIDVDIIIADDCEILNRVIATLKALGYEHVGERGISGREAFKRKSIKTPKTDSNRDWFEHHLYVCKEGSLGLRNHLALKKHLLENPNKVITYSKLKLELANKFPNDMGAYVDGKTEFILSMLNEEGLFPEDIASIKNQNKI